MWRHRKPVPTPEQQRAQRVRDEYAQALRKLRGEPEPQPPAPRELAPHEKCWCGGELLFVGGSWICGPGTHSD